MSSQKRNEVPPPAITTCSHMETWGPAHGMREGTKLKPFPANYFFNDGGMGDYINYLSAILWLAKNAPWVHGNLYCPKSFFQFAERVLRQCINWKVIDGESRPFEMRGDSPIIGPELKVNGENVTPQLINATGAHLMDLGFIYYTNQSKAPPDVMLPRVKLKPEELPRQVAKLKGKYIVFTAGAIVAVRQLRAHHLNPIIEHAVLRGMTPVFLGKTETYAGLTTHYDKQINYAAGLDLRDQTDMLQAASVMRDALCVIGLDNGLLHLAATTEATVLFGYNITGPEFRAPRRNWGHTVHMTVPKERLACAHCQDHIKMLSTHSFHYCLYGDTRCIDILFENEGQAWKSAIDKLLGL